MTINRTLTASSIQWKWLLGVLLLAPIQLGAKGCDTAVVGNDATGGSGAVGGAMGATGGKANVGGATATGGASNPGGNTCGGLLGAACSAGQYCKFALEAQCGAADQTGVCTAIPEVCAEIYQPVCGCDDVTYGNECEAAAKGVSVSSRAACDSGPTVGGSCGGLTGQGCSAGEYCAYAPDAACGAADQMGTCTAIPEACDMIYAPVCGCDGKTYSNECVAASAGISMAAAGACAATPVVCGGLAGKACPDGQYCNFPTTARCGAADQTGTCAVVPGACTKEYNPVCGCDGKTYGNACSAAAAGVSVAAQGACASTTPTGSTCGGLLGTACATGQYCNFPITARCGAADQTGTCANIPDACTMQYDPVCGCDGKTYGNACSAAAAGISVSATGACAS